MTDESNYNKREEIINDAILSAREIQEFLWGKSDGRNGIDQWILMLEKRLNKIRQINFNNPNSIVELRKRLLQNAALSIALMEVIEETNGSLLLKDKL